jgi:hypothetical protein
MTGPPLACNYAGKRLPEQIVRPAKKITRQL